MFQCRLHPGHLYQLSTYLTHVWEREPDQDVSGMLIYPSAGERVRLNYTLLGTPVRIAKVDLAAEWRDIHCEPLELTA